MNIKGYLIVLACIICQVCTAQNREIKDKELASLVEVVKGLRHSTEASYKKALQALTADDHWVTMSETGNLQKTECKPQAKTPSFKLNRILYAAEKERKYVSTKTEMLNGEDRRYNYSLFERILKKGKSATYHLKKRNGKQTIVLVPHVAKKGSLGVLIDGKKPTTTEDEDGTLTCTFNATGKEFALTITNKSGSALSFVILNHNSRKK